MPFSLDPLLFFSAYFAATPLFAACRIARETLSRAYLSRAYLHSPKKREEMTSVLQASLY